MFLSSFPLCSSSSSSSRGCQHYHIPTQPGSKIPSLHSSLFAAVANYETATGTAAMERSQQQKLKPVPRPLFSCGIFRNCTQSVLSPVNPPPAAIPPPTPPPPPPPAPADHPPPRHPPSSSSSSSSSTSPSFTQWRFPLHHAHSDSANPKPATSQPAPGAGGVDLSDAFQAADLHFRAGSALPALRLLEKSLASDPSGSGSACTKEVMAGVVASLREPASARPAAKVLLALLLSEPNRKAAVDAGAVSAAVEAVAAAGSSATATAERALAALELLCTVDDGADEVRSHALAAPALAGAVGMMAGRGRECGIGVLAAVYGGERAREAPEEVGRAVVVAMQGECSARGRRKGAALMRALQENGRLDGIVGADGAIGL